MRSSSSGGTPARKRFTPISTTCRILGQLGRKEEAREKWQKLLGEDPSWTAESFVKWYKLWNIRDEDSAKFMEGIYKTGVLGAEATPGR